MFSTFVVLPAIPSPVRLNVAPPSCSCSCRSADLFQRRRWQVQIASSFKSCHLSQFVARRVRRQTQPQEEARQSPAFFVSNRYEDSWDEIDGNWITRPPLGGRYVKGIVHFLGGAFVGAAPQIAYRHFLERLSGMGYVVVVTPFELNFDYRLLVDKISDKWDAALERILIDYAGEPLPVYSMGHSLGGVLHVLSNCLRKDRGGRAGLVLFSYNNKPATEAIPLFDTLVGPGLSSLRPLVSDQLTLTLASVTDQALMTSERVLASLPFQPPFVKDIVPTVGQLFPVLAQLDPLVTQLSKGAKDFSPSPSELTSLIQSSYSAPRTLLVKFTDDTLDETDKMASVLSATTTQLTVRELPGTHVTLLTQDVDVAAMTGVPLPPQLLDLQRNVRAELFKDWSGLDNVVDAFLEQPTRPSTANNLPG